MDQVFLVMVIRQYAIVTRIHRDAVIFSGFIKMSTVYYLTYILSFFVFRCYDKVPEEKRSNKIADVHPVG